MRLFAVNSFSPGPPLATALGAPGTTVLQLIAEDLDYGESAHGAHFSHDSRWLVTSSFDGSIRLYNLSSVERAPVSAKALRPAVSQKAPGGSHPYSVKFSPDSSKVSVVYGDTIGVSVLSARDLHLLYSPNTTGQTDRNGVLLTTAWSKDGQGRLQR